MDLREAQFTEQRRRDQLRRAAHYRLLRHAAPPRPRFRFLRPALIWTGRVLIRAGVRLFLLSKTWEQRGNAVYNEVNEWEPLAFEAAAE